MIKIVSEWDFGTITETTVFKTKMEALMALKNDLNVQEMCQADGTTVEQLVAENLISFQELFLG
jgi:hypothetical protein